MGQSIYAIRGSIGCKKLVMLHCSVEEDKILESALAEFWDVDNRCQDCISHPVL